MALFQASLQQHTLPGGGLAAAANGPTRSTARAGHGAARRGGGGGHHSPPKQPPPLFDAGQQAQQAQPAGTLHHWKSEVSANMAALGPLPNGLGNGAAAPAGAADPISPRAVALMAACQAEAEQAPPLRLSRLTSNLSSAAEALGAGDAPGPAAAAGAAAAAVSQAAQPLAKQRSDLADLAQMAEEEWRAATAVQTPAPAAGGTAPAEGAAAAEAPAVAAEGAEQPAGSLQLQGADEQAVQKRPAEDGCEQPAAKRQRGDEAEEAGVPAAVEPAPQRLQEAEVATPVRDTAPLGGQ